jgi:hypothetical protein
VKELVLFFGILHQGINEQGIGFGVNVFDSDLEAVEEFRFGILNLGNEVLSEVFVHDAIAGSEKCQHVRDEVLLSVVKIGPIAEVMTQIDFFGGPEASLGLFIELPDFVLLNREEDESVFVLLENRLLFHGVAHGNRVLKVKKSSTGAPAFANSPLFSCKFFVA